MKKIMAFMLTFILAFTSISAVRVEAGTRVSDEAKALVTIGMLEGDGGGVTEEYMKKEMDRFTAAISILKLRGLYEDALNYKGVSNFVDIDEVKWSDGKRILAYLKANPDIGFIGNDRGEFKPYISINEQSYYKVLLETLGYKQSNGGVDGDFSWKDTLKYAQKIGLKPTNNERFNIDLLAKATVTALNTKTKTGKVYINVLIDAGKIKRSKALAAGLIRDTLDVSIKSVKAIGNTTVEVVFDEEVDRYDLENMDNYSISGLTIKDAVSVSNDVVRLETSAQSVGKLYTLKAGEAKANFTGIAKVSGSPRIKLVKSEDVETVVIEFDKELDFYSASNKDNYYISGVDIMEAEVCGKKVTLTTHGLSVRKQYSIKVTNIKSIDGALLKSGTASFYTRADTYPPTVKDVKVKTNQRVMVTFSEAVSRDTAENVGNYIIKSGNEELDILKAELVDKEDDEEDTVELTTEIQRPGARYEITIENISDKTKSANVMKRPVKKTFYGMREDRTPPQLARNDIKVLSRNHLQLAFTDSSRMDETTVLDPSNYEVIRNDRYKDEIYVQSVEKVSYDDDKYKVILNLDDLSINTGYTIKVYNIADEFGNVLEKNNSLSISVKRDDFAASTVRDYKVVSGNEIEVYFTKPLNKHTAEDISNYEINNSIGYPLSANYKDEKLVLKTATMTEGKIYKLVINGVSDQAGNNLKLSFEFRATEGESDEISPRLEYIYSVNKYVVAAVFDEPVRYTTEGYNETILVLKSGKSEIELCAKALSDDNRVIEFSDIAGKKTLAGYGVYTVDSEKSLKGITDRSANRNKFDTGDLIKYYDLQVYGNYDEPEVPEIYYINQRDGKTFEMELSKEVVIEKNSVDTIGTPAATFAVSCDSKDEKIVTFTITSSRYIDGYKDYKIDISKVLTDKHGIKVENTYETKGYSIFYGEYKDEDKPYIVDVTAIDRFTLEIEYNEAIGYEGRYTIKNTDDTVYYKTIPNTLKKIDNNKVILSLSSPLEGRYDYRLIIDAQAKDLVGNSSEDIKGDEFYFVGTDLAPVNVPDVDYKDAEELVIELEKAVEDLSNSDKINKAKTLYILADKEVDNIKDITLKKSLKNRIGAAGDKIQQAEDKLAAADVEIKINGLPEIEKITLEHKNEVKTVRDAYNELTDSQKKFVTNYNKLLAAENKILDLESEQQKLAEGKKKQEADKLAAAVVIEKIEKLPKELSLTDKDAAGEARVLYNALTDSQKKLVINYYKLTAAEMEIAKLEKQQKELEEEQQRLAEEEAKRKAEEEAKIAAAEEKVKALESAIDEEALGGKIAALSDSILEMEKALSAYLTPVEMKALDKEKEADNTIELGKEEALQKAIVSADAASKKVNEIIEGATVLEAAADEAFDKLPESEAKSSLKAKIETAESKIENGRKANEEAKMKIAEAKVKAATKWLTVDKFKFSDNKADAITRIILGLEPHKMGAVYQYVETNKTTDSKSLTRRFSNKTDSANLQIVEEKKDGKISQYIIVTGGKEDAIITLKVKITSDSAIGYKLFNVNIPALTSSKPVTIVEMPAVPDATNKK